MASRSQYLQFDESACSIQIVPFNLYNTSNTDGCFQSRQGESISFGQGEIKYSTKTVEIGSFNIANCTKYNFTL